MAEKPSKQNLSHVTPTPQANVKTEQAQEKSLKHPSQMSHMKQC